MFAINICIKKTHRISPEQYPFIFARYQAGALTTQLGAEYGVSPQSIYGLLKRHNIPIRPRTESQRKYKLNETVLDQIDTEEKAYLIGFISSDAAYHNEERGVLSIHLHKRDQDILYNLNRVIGSNNSIKSTTVVNKNGTKTPVAYLRIYSKIFSKRVIELGIKQQKIHTLEFLNRLNPSLNPHFIRGYFDADGSFSSKRGKSVLFTGSKPFCENLMFVIKNECGINQVSIKVNDKNVTISINGKDQLVSLYHYLYDMANILGKRKKNLFEKYILD